MRIKKFRAFLSCCHFHAFILFRTSTFLLAPGISNPLTTLACSSLMIQNNPHITDFKKRWFIHVNKLQSQWCAISWRKNYCDHWWKCMAAYADFDIYILKSVLHFLNSTLICNFVEKCIYVTRWENTTIGRNTIW